MAVIQEITEEVAKFKREFLAILRLLDWQVFIHGVSRQVIKVTEHLIALDNPSNLKII